MRRGVSAARVSRRRPFDLLRNVQLAVITALSLLPHDRGTEAPGFWTLAAAKDSRSPSSRATRPQSS